MRINYGIIDWIIKFCFISTFLQYFKKFGLEHKEILVKLNREDKNKIIYGEPSKRASIEFLKN